MLDKLMKDLKEMSRTAQVYYKNEQWVLLERTIKQIDLLTTMINNNLEKNERMVPSDVR